MKRTLSMTRIVATGLTASGTPVEEFPGHGGAFDGFSLKPKRLTNRLSPPYGTRHRFSGFLR